MNSSAVCYSQAWNCAIQGCIHNCDSFTSVESSRSIDDYLAQDQHERSSISSFLACLEEPETASNQTSCNTTVSSAYNSLSQRTSVDIVALAASCSDKNKAKRDREDNQIYSGRLYRNAPRSGTIGVSKEELKRIKNREYQRRFREKKMRFLASCLL